MKAIRIIVGILASVFVVMHLLDMPRFLESFSSVPEHVHVSRWIGKGTAIFIGVCIAILCFRGRKKEETRQQDDPLTEGQDH